MSTSSFIRQYYILITALYFSLGCGKPIETKNGQFNPAKKVVFVEERRKDSGIGSPPYGDLVLMDIESGVQEMLTDNDYYKNYPFFSPGGDTIIFQANDIDDPSVLAVKGTCGPYQTYLLDLSNKKKIAFKVRYQIERAPYLRSTLMNLQMMDGKKIVFRFLGTNQVYTFRLGEDSIKLLKRFDEFNKIGELSYKKGRIVFQYHGKGNSIEEYGVAAYDLSSDRTEILANDEWRIGGWSSHGDAILLSRDSVIYEYNFVLLKKKEVFKTIKRDSLAIDEPFYVTDSTVVFLGRHILNVPVESFQNPLGNSEVYIANILAQTMRQVTKNGKNKEYLRAFISK